MVHKVEAVNRGRHSNGMAGIDQVSLLEHNSRKLLYNDTQYFRASPLRPGGPTPVHSPHQAMWGVAGLNPWLHNARIS